MNSAAIKQNPDSWSALFAHHLRAVERRSAEALARTGYEALLVHAGTPPLVFLDDFHLPFKAHAPFKVWAPLIDAPDSFVYYAPGKKPLLLVHQPVDYWHKSPELPDTYWSRQFEIVSCPDRAAARAALPRDLSRTAFVGVPFPELMAWGPGTINPEHLIAQLDWGRAAKSPYEIACLLEANRLGALGHVAAEKAFRAGASEFEIALAFMGATGHRERELPYNPIIALNEGGAVLHYQIQQRTRPARLHSLLIDAGAEFGGYASDITRTHSHHDAEFAAMVKRFDELQLALCAQVQVGLDWRDFHQSSYRAISEFLREVGLINVSADEAIDSALTSVFYPHGIGHLLGIQVHDVGGTQRDAGGGTIERPYNHPFLRLTRKLEDGAVVTVEPGFYLIDQLLNEAKLKPIGRMIEWQRVEQLKPFGGIRIEDNVVARNGASENLTRMAFSAL
ncbi:MAG TPA: Xaa-Pro dipeptidase [Steroidobacteraceae bacterium]|nr:Xaa-Pro dipeptidase [Steroidobacteraceae bacterium]